MRSVRHAGLTGLLVASVMLAAGSIALAAHPKRSARFAGSGRLCENNTLSHRYTNCIAHRDKFSFRTSANGAKVTSFAGQIGPFYCGLVSNTVGVKFIRVHRDGAFSFRFSTPNRVGGKVNGTSHVQIRGKFTSSRSATVFYKLVTHFNVSSPDCGAQVTGTAHSG